MYTCIYIHIQHNIKEVIKNIVKTIQKKRENRKRSDYRYFPQRLSESRTYAAPQRYTYKKTYKTEN